MTRAALTLTLLVLSVALAHAAPPKGAGKTGAQNVRVVKTPPRPALPPTMPRVIVGIGF